MESFNLRATSSSMYRDIMTLLGKMVHSNLVKQIQYLKTENQILRGRLKNKIRLRPEERRRVLKFGLLLGKELKAIISIVTYRTFRRWVTEREGKRVTQHKKRGRPRTHEYIRNLILRIARETGWGYTRILGELKKLGVRHVSRNTVKNILKENGLDIGPKRGEDSWDDFIKRHFETLMACDFFTKIIWTLKGPKLFFVLFFINVSTRKIHIAGVTGNPTKKWILEKIKSVPLPSSSETSEETLLIRDGDAKFTKEFDDFFEKQNIKVKQIPYKSPNLNPYAESWIGTIKRECINCFIVLGKEHLEHLVQEYVRYYNSVRPHSSVDIPYTDCQEAVEKGTIACESRLGGVIKSYYRESL